MSQLELFPVYTDEQLKRLNHLREDHIVQQKNKQKRNHRRQQLLQEGGFVEGVDYKFTDEFGKYTAKFNVGTWDNKIIVEEELETYIGVCEIKYLSFTEYDGRLKHYSTIPYMENRKLGCYEITGRHSSYIPSSLKEKLVLNNDKAEADYKRYIANKDITKNTIEKYQKQFPKCEVKSDSVYSKYTKISTKTVCVKFPNGSYIQFGLGSEMDKEYIYSKYDAATKDMNKEELLTYFNNQ